MQGLPVRHGCPATTSYAVWLCCRTVGIYGMHGGLLTLGIVDEHTSWPSPSSQLHAFDVLTAAVSDAYS